MAWIGGVDGCPCHRGHSGVVGIVLIGIVLMVIVIGGIIGGVSAP